MFLPWIPVPNDERQQEQGSKTKHSRVTRTSGCVQNCKLLASVLSLTPAHIGAHHYIDTGIQGKTFAVTLHL